MSRHGTIETIRLVSSGPSARPTRPASTIHRRTSSSSSDVEIGSRFPNCLPQSCTTSHKFSYFCVVVIALIAVFMVILGAKAYFASVKLSKDCSDPRRLKVIGPGEVEPKMANLIAAELNETGKMGEVVIGVSSLNTDVIDDYHVSV